MTLNSSEIGSRLNSLGTPDEVRALAESGFGQSFPLLSNAHIHLPPNFSAFDSVEQAVDLAAQEQIRVLGVSNYYDYQVYDEFTSRAHERGIFPLYGLEVIAMQDDLRGAGIRVNDPGNPGKTYLCGKGITRFEKLTPGAAKLIEVIRRNDSQRMAEMVRRVGKFLDQRGLATAIDNQAVTNRIVERHGSPQETVFLQERHISQAFQEELFRLISTESRIGRLTELLGTPVKLSDPQDYVGVQNELRSHLMKAGKPAFVEESFLSFAEARQLVLELGGIPSYPVLADGVSPICEFEAEPDKLIQELKAREVYAAEWIPVRNARAVVEQYVPRMREAGLVVTAGTEHNTLDMIPFDPACKDDELPDTIRKIFWEGTCVVAAHQFLTSCGECGYVDANGRLNPAYSSHDERIRSLAWIGAVVIRRYLDTCCNN